MSYRDECDEHEDNMFEDRRKEAYVKAFQRFEGMTLEEQVGELIQIYAENERSKIKFRY